MDFKLHGGTGQCVCSVCYEAVGPHEACCESCGTMLEGELEARNCPFCERLINTEANVCPICNEKIKASPEEKRKDLTLKELDKEDEAFLLKLAIWREDSETPTQDILEIRKEREQALKMLRSVSNIELDEILGKWIREIEETSKEREDFEKEGKRLLQLGKPFETVLERNIEDLNLIENELDKKNADLNRLEREKGETVQEMRNMLNEDIVDLQKNKQEIKSNKSNILLMGRAYKKLLDQHKSELYNIETGLTKRIVAFQREVESRSTQKKKLHGLEVTLDEKEEKLSKRSLELEERENELMLREELSKKRLEELEAKEEELKALETTITLGSDIEDEKENLRRIKEVLMNEDRRKKGRENELLRREMDLEAARKVFEEEQNRLNGRENELLRREMDLEVARKVFEEEQNRLNGRENELLKGEMDLEAARKLFEEEQNRKKSGENEFLRREMDLEAARKVFEEEQNRLNGRENELLKGEMDLEAARKVFEEEQNRLNGREYELLRREKDLEGARKVFEEEQNKLLEREANLNEMGRFLTEQQKELEN